MRTSLATNKNSEKNNTVCTRYWSPPGNQSYMKEKRRAAGKSTSSSTLLFLKVLRTSTRHSTGYGIPVPSNSTSVRFWQKHVAPTLQRSASIRPKGISIEYADLMHFSWSFLFVGLLTAFAIPRLLQAVLVLILLLTHAPPG
jgi:hypothetical protein